MKSPRQTRIGVSPQWTMEAADSFADVDIAFTAALAVVDEKGAYKCRLSQPKLLVQQYEEPDGDLVDRFYVERETDDGADPARHP